MRAISLVKKIEFEFTGNVARNAVTLGDVDNDGCNELIVGNQNGDIAIFKGKEKLQSISKLGFITCIAVGDVTNQKRNVLTIITADGWCYLYAAPENILDDSVNTLDESVDQVDGQINSTSGTGSSENLPIGEFADLKIKKDDSERVQLICIHMQRIPANCKDIVLGDVDGDGMIEMILGLTDRVVRSYRWVANPYLPALNLTDSCLGFEPSDKLLGKFVALNKWECANQIGSITLHHSLDGKACLLIAQPGGTFMRIKCQSDDSNEQSSMENVYHSNSESSTGEHMSGSVDYQSLGITRMRNQNISTEILGDLRNPQHADENNPSRNGMPYALATLDGTIILVKDEVILWAIAVDHQIFALTKMDVTGNGSDDIVVCCWDGQTYILDQEKNSLRFHLDEPVQAFASDYYGITTNVPDVTSLVYVTFKNSIVIYYDLPLRELTCKKFEPDPEKLSELFVDGSRSKNDALELVKNMSKKAKKELVGYILYNT
ncbi:KICSTOR complex protein ITFG2 [Leptinotarsa decemlineata]|uniref:KICSTOR complex protein ITFG2 n=1 Tax=Leptinotarsa decemlineata TaxID=7539 RepID=UPI003D306FCE